MTAWRRRHIVQATAIYWTTTTILLRGTADTPLPTARNSVRPDPKNWFQESILQLNPSIARSRQMAITRCLAARGTPVASLNLSAPRCIGLYCSGRKSNLCGKSISSTCSLAASSPSSFQISRLLVSSIELSDWMVFSGNPGFKRLTASGWNETL